VPLSQRGGLAGRSRGSDERRLGGVLTLRSPTGQKAVSEGMDAKPIFPFVPGVANLQILEVHADTAHRRDRPSVQLPPQFIPQAEDYLSEIQSMNRLIRALGWGRGSAVPNSVRANHNGNVLNQRERGRLRDWLRWQERPNSIDRAEWRDLCLGRMGTLSTEIRRALHEDVFGYDVLSLLRAG